MNEIVKAALESAQTDGNRLTLTSQLDRKDYLAVAKAIEAMGGKWNRKEKCHVFAGDAAQAVQDVLANGEVVDLRKEYQFFETPQNVAAQLVAFAGIKPGMHVLEPSAGRGALVAALQAEGASVIGVELWDENRKALEAAGVALFSEPDFMKLRAPGDHKLLFDAVVANPPFANRQDQEHVLHMLEWVRPGGYVTSVMSPGWRFRQDGKSTAFRMRMKELAATWEELPPASFKASGTTVNAGILRVRRPIESAAPAPNDVSSTSDASPAAAKPTPAKQREAKPKVARKPAAPSKPAPAPEPPAAPAPQAINVSALRALPRERRDALYAALYKSKPPATAIASVVCAAIAKKLALVQLPDGFAELAPKPAPVKRKPAEPKPKSERGELNTREHQVVMLLRDLLRERGSVDIVALETAAKARGIDITMLTPYRRRGRDRFVERMALRLQRECDGVTTENGVALLKVS